MNKSFRPLTLAAAVAAAVTPQAFAQDEDLRANLYDTQGEAALIPYYTVQGDWVTGIHIINISRDETVPVKFRMRRAADSEDVFDFNIVLSPLDEWTGTIRGDENSMEVFSEDKTCTVPAFPEGNGTIAPLKAENLEGAQEGYIEVFGMAQADEDQPISKAAVHVNGTPVDCNEVRSNFFADALLDNETTVGGDGTSTYDNVGDILRVTYFVRDNNSGIEFGNSAYHFDSFNDNEAMTHQEFGIESYATEGVAALNGWDFPDVRGGGNNYGSSRSEFQEELRNTLDSDFIVNDWSYNPATGAATDWVVTFPGQYAMVDYWALQDLPADPTVTWDYREIPVIATFKVYDREEGEGVPGGLDFSPSPAPDAALLPYEVNVVNWGPDADVLDSAFTTRVNPADAGVTSPVGWASLTVEGTPKFEGGAAGGAELFFSYCDVAAGPDNADGDVPSEDGRCDMYSVSGPVPMMGFAAWERTFDDPDKNYGRIIDHGILEIDD